jgi:hypothetical protein
MPLLGLLAWIDYHLSRLRFLALGLDSVILVGTIGLTLYALIVRYFRQPWPFSPVVLVLLAIWCVGALLLKTRNFVIFRPSDEAAPSRQLLPPFQKIAVRASGLFEIRVHKRYLVNEPSFLEATELGDRVLMAKLRPLSILGLARTPAEEWGWWYLFFRVEEIASVTSGYLYFGLRRRPALKLRHHGKHPDTVLSFPDRDARDRVAADLRKPAG